MNKLPEITAEKNLAAYPEGSEDEGHADILGIEMLVQVESYMECSYRQRIILKQDPVRHSNQSS